MLQNNSHRRQAFAASVPSVLRMEPDNFTKIETNSGPLSYEFSQQIFGKGCCRPRGAATSRSRSQPPGPASVPLLDKKVNSTVDTDTLNVVTKLLQRLLQFAIDLLEGISGGTPSRGHRLRESAENFNCSCETRSSNKDVYLIVSIGSESSSTHEILAERMEAWRPNHFLDCPSQQTG